MQADTGQGRLAQCKYRFQIAGYKVSEARQQGMSNITDLHHGNFNKLAGNEWESAELRESGKQVRKWAGKVT